MILNELMLAGFRSYPDKKFVFDNRGGFFSGRNGSGKTNVLEAIYLLGFAKSFRTNRMEDLIAWNSPEASIQAIYTDNNGLQNELVVCLDKKKSLS